MFSFAGEACSNVILWLNARRVLALAALISTLALAALAARALAIAALAARALALAALLLKILMQAELIFSLSTIAAAAAERTIDRLGRHCP